MEKIIIISIALIVFTAIGIRIYTFIKAPTDQQLKNLREWLLYAVTIAEKEFGNGTGQIKLRYVYNMFIEKFPNLSKVITFNSFSNLVDGSLDKLKDMLKSNVNLQEYLINKEEK